MADNATLEDLVTQVGNLTEATTELLDATQTSKSDLEKTAQASIDAASRAKTAADSTDKKAAEAKNSASGAKKAEQNAVKVVYDGDASLDPAAGKIPVADSSGKINKGWLPEVTSAVPTPDFDLPLVSDLKLRQGFIGDPTLTRATTANYVREGINRTAANDVPRFEKNGLLLESSNTNTCHDADLRIAFPSEGEPWTKSTKQERPLVSGWIAETWEFDTSVTGGSARFRLANAGDTTAGSSRLGIFVKPENITKLSYGTNGNNHKNFSCEYDFTTKTIKELTHVTGSKMRNLGNGWWYLTHTTYSHTSIIGIDHYIKAMEYTGTPKLTVCNPHRQNYEMFDSVIPFGRTATSRASDKCLIPANVATIPSVGDFTFYCQVNSVGGPYRPWGYILAYNNEVFTSHFSDRNKIRGLCRGDATQYSIDCDARSGNPIKIAVRVKGTNLTVFNLTEHTQASFSVSEAYGTTSGSIHIGGVRAATDALNGNLKDLKIWHHALTDAQIQTL